jgi:tryprostatin B 6-hydroxylase
VIRLLPRSDNFVQADRLHKKYGDIVRVGPNELTIIDPDAVAAIHGSNSKCIKSAWYDAIGGENPSLQLTRDRAIHDRRRKVWDQAFSVKCKPQF